MIDSEKCDFEEAFSQEKCDIYYYVYPKDLEETEFYGEEDYGRVVAMCISLTREEDGECYLQMSPTVEEEDCFVDVDWRDLFPGVNYTPETVMALLAKAKEGK